MLRFIHMLFMLSDRRRRSCDSRYNTCYLYPKPYFTEEGYLAQKKGLKGRRV